jgi:hypothetical protein
MSGYNDVMWLDWGALFLCCLSDYSAQFIAWLYERQACDGDNLDGVRNWFSIRCLITAELKFYLPNRSVV